MFGVIKFLLPIFVATSTYSTHVDSGLSEEIASMKTLLTHQSAELAIQRSRIVELEEQAKIRSSKIAMLEEMVDNMEYRPVGQPFRSHSNASLLQEVQDKIHGDLRLPRGYSSPIAFYAYKSHGFSNVAAYTPMVYDAVVTNEGSGYNSHTGVFTAPTSGLYAFAWVITVSGRDPVGDDLGEISIEILQSGHSRGTVHADTELKNDDDSATGFVILSLHASEPVYLRSTNYAANQGSFTSTASHERWSFAGFRIG